MKIVCDTDKRALLPLERVLQARGWFLYDDICKDFCSHPEFFGGKIVPVSKALAAERILAKVSMKK